MNKQISLATISQAINAKTVGVGVRSFINTSRCASKNDLVSLYDRVLNGKDALANAYKDNAGFWHFITVA